MDDLLISIVPPFICSNSPNRRPSLFDILISLFLHSFAQTHQIDDPLISLFLHSFAQTHQIGRPSDIHYDPDHPLFLHSFAQTHQIDDPLISTVSSIHFSNSPNRRPSPDIHCSSIHLLKTRHLISRRSNPVLISTVPPFICSKPNRRPSDILGSNSDDPLISTVSSIHLSNTKRPPLISTVPPFICSNTPADDPLISTVPPFICSTHQIDDLIHCFLHSFAQTHQVDDLLISTTTPLISLFLHSFVPPWTFVPQTQTHQIDDPLISLDSLFHSFAQTHQIDDPLISTVPPFICSNSPSGRPSDIHCSSIHLLKLTNRRPLISLFLHSFAQTHPSRRPSDIHCSSIHLLKLTKDDPLISTVPPFICSNSPNRRPSDIHYDPLISFVPPFICSNSPSRRPSDIHCSSIHFAQTHQIETTSFDIRPSDIHCSSIHLLNHQVGSLQYPLFLHSFCSNQPNDPLICTVPPILLKLTKGRPFDIPVPPFICSKLTVERPSDIHCSSTHLLQTRRRPSDIHCSSIHFAQTHHEPSFETPLFLHHSFAQTHKVDDPLISCFPPFICSKLTKFTNHSICQTHQMISTVPLFICSNSPNDPSDIHCFLPFKFDDLSDIQLHSFQTHQIDDPLISLFLHSFSNSPNRRPSDIHCSSIHFAQTHQVDDLLISLFLHSFCSKLTSSILFRLQLTSTDDPSDIHSFPPFIAQTLQTNFLDIHTSVPPYSFAQTHQVDASSDIHCSSIHLLKSPNRRPSDIHFSPFICSNSPNRRPSDIHCSSHLLKLTQIDDLLDIHLHSFAQNQVDVPLISTVPPFICSNSPNRRPSDIHLDDPLISTVPPFICSNSHQIDDPLISTVPPFICSNSPNRRPLISTVPPFICSNTPSRRPSDIPLFLHSFAQTHQVDDPLISCSSFISPSRRPSDIHCSSIHLLKLTK
ncbi:unnamed protein product [Acanthosepion pharaonis]|uniref:Uncharacterized protein n=1 Tax=Acanthosepion pharaonis TaxID=158019 RepID=A0A812B3H7_ACAPH|nr:unnamed protein product [Sepia pharaonis]